MQIVCALAAGALGELETRGDVARWSGARVSWTLHATRILSARAWRDFDNAEVYRCRGAHVDAQGIPQVAAPHSALRDLARVRALLDHTRAFGKCLEIADAKANAASSARWLQDGAARGGRDVHRFSRVPGGWVPSPRVPHEEDFLEEVADLHDVQMQHPVTRQVPSTRVGQPSVIPASPQQESDKEAREWADQWGVGLCLPQVTWPSASCAPPETTTAQLIEAIHNFPEGTALGTDRYHPRILLRWNPAFLDTLIKVIMLCETLGFGPLQSRMF